MTPLSTLLADGPRLSLVAQDLLAAAAQQQEWTAVAQVALDVRDAEDPLRSLAVLQLATGILVDAATARPEQDPARRELAISAVTLLSAWLEADPHEPALLELLGRALLLVEERATAREAFRALGALTPDHPHVLAHLDACRMPGSSGPTSVTSIEARTIDSRTRARVEEITAAAAVLPERTVSLCMIVRDEEQMLPGCLASAAPYVDEIIVVDTGSVDRTRAIAEEAGATVIDRPWDGSFSTARNAAIDAATSDWVIWLDADEQLVGDDGAQLRALARQTWVEAFHVVETHLTGTGEQGASAVHAPVRMIRNRPHYRWTGLVHEQVAHALPMWFPGRIEQSSVRVNHFGYVASVVNERSKRRRNLDLLHAQLEQERTAFTCFNIGSEHASMGDFSEARRWFEEALERVQLHDGWQENGFASLLVQRTVTARRAAGDLLAAIELATRGLAWWSDYTDLVYEQAAAYVQLGDEAAARRAAERALEMGDAPARYVGVSGKGSFRARALLAGLLRRANDKPGAQAQLEQALVEEPRAADIAEQLVEVLLDSGSDAEHAVARVASVLQAHGMSSSMQLAIGTLLHDRGHRTMAGACYAEVLEAKPQDGAALAALAELELADGNLMAAWETGLALDPLDARSAIGARSSLLAAAAIGDVELVAEPARRITSSTLLDASERSVYGAWAGLLDPQGETVESFVPHDPAAAAVVLRNLEALARLEATDAFEQLHTLLPRVMPEERERRLTLAELYLKLRFADLAAVELLTVAEHDGVDAGILTSLGKVATLKQQWEDAEVFVTEALALEPNRSDARRLLEMLRARPTA